MRQWDSPAAPASKVEQVREPPERTRAHSSAHESEKSLAVSAGAAPVRGSYRSLEQAACRLHPAAAMAVPAPLPKAWEASRSPAKAPDPERPLARRVGSRPLRELQPSGHAPPNIPTRSTTRTRAKGRRQSLAAQPCVSVTSVSRPRSSSSSGSSPSGSSLSKYSAHILASTAHGLQNSRHYAARPRPDAVRRARKKLTAKS